MLVSIEVQHRGGGAGREGHIVVGRGGGGGVGEIGREQEERRRQGQGGLIVGTNAGSSIAIVGWV